MNWLPTVLKFFGLDFVYAEIRTFIVWLGNFAWDKEKNQPSTRNGVALMCATSLCAGFLWVAGWSPWKVELQKILVDYAWVISISGGLGVAAAVLPKVWGNKKPPAGKQEGDV